MLGCHTIFSTYGFWLPNDPRGSGSALVTAQHIYEVGGEATKVETRRSVAANRHDVELRLLAKAALKRPAVVLNGLQARAVVRGIAALLPKIEISIHALAVMPDHVHVVTANHPYSPDEILAALKRAATRGMNADSLHPFAGHPRSNGRLPSPWGEKGWKVFLFQPADMRRAIRYVEQNPVRAGLKLQRWSCVTPYDA